MASDSDTMAPAEILARVRAELVELGRAADDLQVTIGAVAGVSAAPLNADTQMRLQAADALSQRLERLAQVVAALERGADECATFHPDRCAGLSYALQRLPPSEAAPLQAILEEAGECEIF